VEEAGPRDLMLVFEDPEEFRDAAVGGFDEAMTLTRVGDANVSTNPMKGEERHKFGRLK
jgi:hypothetical protein